MKTPNKVLMSQARESLKGKWGLAIKFLLLYFVINLAIGFVPIIGLIAKIFIAGPFMMGMAVFWLILSRNQNPKLGLITDGFEKFWRSFKGYWLVAIYTFLWMLLLIIPGIIAVYSYSQTFFILAEDKTIGANAAIDKSKQIMKGNKWKLFRLQLRFLGLWLLLMALPIITWGIGVVSVGNINASTLSLAPLAVVSVILFIIAVFGGMLWLTPYMWVSMAKFYDDVKEKKESEVPEVVAVPLAA